jgi:DNA-binding transcriptional LysR family regulator
MPWSDRIGRRVKLRDLHVLLAVAETRSMAKAAERLAISQPVVSKTIADLEHALGVRLLDRTSQGVEPTAYGRSFINCGTAVFDEMRRGVQDIEFLADPTAGEVRIGAASPYVDFVTAGVARLAARYPRIEWYVAEGDTPVCCRMLRERKIDVGIGRLGSPVASDLNSDPLYEDTMSVVAGLDNRWARRSHGVPAIPSWFWARTDLPKLLFQMRRKTSVPCVLTTRPFGATYLALHRTTALDGVRCYPDSRHCSAPAACPLCARRRHSAIRSPRRRVPGDLVERSIRACAPLSS